MQLFEQGLEYWRIAKRFHAHRQYQGMRPVAVSDMIGLLPKTSCDAVKRRIHAFISKNAERPTTPPKRTA